MAEPLDIIAEIDALTVHCRPPLMDVEQRARWQRDWAQDLEKYPIEVIRHAFRDWRQGEHLKFPTPGQLIPMLERLVRRPEAKPDGAAVAWSYDISDGDYRALSLNDKIRHHRAAANHCRRKAGPMPHTGPAIRREDMPADWHDLHDRADRHDLEAKRLQQSIGMMDQRA